MAFVVVSMTVPASTVAAVGRHALTPDDGITYCHPAACYRAAN